MLLEKADIQGYLTSEDLVEVYPEAGTDVEHLEAILVALRRRGVDVLDAESETAFEDDTATPATDLDPTSNLETVSSDDTISLYLKEMSRVALLTMAEEVDLARRIEVGKAAKKDLDGKNGSNSEKRKKELGTLMEGGARRGIT